MSTASLYQVPDATPTISFELFPPRSSAGARALPETVRRLAERSPDYFSVTYGASGATRETSRALLQLILSATDVKAIAHLTCVGASEAELEAVIGELLQIGVRDVLALRGDPPAGQTQWQPHPQGLTSTTELVRLLRRVEDRDLPGDQLSISVAAYPGGSYRVNGRPDVDPTAISSLRAKQDAGADFAITQVFFDPQSYGAFVQAARDGGVHLPIVPGIIPLTDPARLRRLESLTGVQLPEALMRELEGSEDPDERYATGLRASVDLVQGVLREGAPGLHVYTFNQSEPALDLLAAAGLRAAATRA